MPKNTGKGGKHFKKRRNVSYSDKRQLEFKEPGQEYSKIIKMLGNGRCECFCSDGLTRLGHIRGNMLKKVWISVGDIVLVSIREFQNSKADIIHKYTFEESKILKEYGEIDFITSISKEDNILDEQNDNDDLYDNIDFNDI